MSHKPDYDRGRDDALRWAVTWLHKRSAEMNDGHAKAILNSAAFHLGVEINGPKISPPQSGEVTDGRRSGHSKLVYDKATRSIVTVRTPQSEREVEAVALARASLVEMMEEGPNLRVKGNRHDRARAAIAALDALRARAGEA